MQLECDQEPNTAAVELGGEFGDGGLFLAAGVKECLRAGGKWHLVWREVTLTKWMSVR